MKKIDKLVLNQISKKELTQRQLGRVKGGRACACGCCYANSGGSDNVDKAKQIVPAILLPDVRKIAMDPHMLADNQLFISKKRVSFFSREPFS